jgi:CBS domain-containing protein
MHCQDIMKRDVEHVAPDATCYAAACKMKIDNIGFLPVCDSSMHVLGTLTDRDIAIRVVGECLPADTFVRHVMTPEVVACGPTDDLRTAEELMSRHQKSRIMCLDDEGRLVGVISLSDIAQHGKKRDVVRTMQFVTRREVREAFA